MQSVYCQAAPARSGAVLRQERLWKVCTILACQAEALATPIRRLGLVSDAFPGSAHCEVTKVWNGELMAYGGLGAT